MSEVLRAGRFEKGALATTSLRLSFKLDDNGNPIDCGQYEQTEANRLVEEVSVRLSFLEQFLMNVEVHASYQHRCR